MLAVLAALVTLGQPVVWARIDVGELKGRPACLAWSEDRSELYLQMVEGTDVHRLKWHHYLIKEGKPPQLVAEQPGWVQEYWTWKSAKSFFRDPLMTIEVDVRQTLLDNLNGTSDNKAVYLQPYVTGEALMRSKQSGGSQMTSTLLLKNKIVGRFVDELVVPGYTFSWSPEDLRLIAFRSPQGRLVIMNGEGETQDVAGTTDVLLPAWSDDGRVIGFLERTGRRTFSIIVVPVL
ncbi:MAG TPA: hypothetical protein VF219_17915 [Vicinamibacterales bacterium]